MEQLKILIEGSGRHMHVTQAHLDVLFGAGYELEKKKMLSQPGEFLSDCKVDVVGAKGTINGISILGPCRVVTQVELSFSDARILGITAPIRESGDVADSAPITLVGPKGSVELAEGGIIAKRHIHLIPETAEKYGLENKEIVQVIAEGTGGRKMIFDDVVARVSPTYADAMHIDYDEMNAGALFGEQFGTVIKKA